MPKVLAIDGGSPAFPDGPPPWPVADDTIIRAVNDALRSGQWGQYDGDLIANLKRSICETFATEQAMLCSSGTIAVELALRACGVGQGDEVVIAGYDFAGNFRSIESVGAAPVVIDVLPQRWTIDPVQLATALSPTTSAVIVSHLHGDTACMDEILDVIQRHNERHHQRGGKTVRIVEDMCQSPGGHLGQRMLGSFGDITTLSFGGSKLLSAGRGGAILSKDEAMIQRANVFSFRGNDAFPLSQIQAALLIPQVDQLESRNARRLESAKKIAAAVNAVEQLRSLQGDAFENRSRPAFYKLPIAVAEEAPFTREALVHVLQKEGIAINAGFRGFCKRSSRRCRRVGALNHSEVAAERTMVLHHPILLSDAPAVDCLIDTIGRAVQYCVKS